MNSMAMACHTNCAVLNLSSCTFKIGRQNRVRQVRDRQTDRQIQSSINITVQVEYDRDGCFVEEDYFRDGDKFTQFHKVSRY